jgi:hypothetical protein
LDEVGFVRVIVQYLANLANGRIDTVVGVYEHLPSPNPFDDFGEQTGRNSRTKLIGVIALVAVIIAVLGGGLYYRPHHAKRLTAKDTIVLADFANSTGDAIFDETLKTALRLSLNQSPFLNVLSSGKVEETLQQMTRPPGTKLTPDVARELCQRAGSEAYIGGAIGSLGSKYVLELKAVNCRSGDSFADQQVTAESKEKVLDALGGVASKLRGELGESLASVQKLDIPLAQATTSSLEALKAYSLGARSDQSARSLVYFQRAIELDPNFAMAMHESGVCYENLNQPWAGQRVLRQGIPVARTCQ